MNEFVSFAYGEEGVRHSSENAAFEMFMRQLIWMIVHPAFVISLSGSIRRRLRSGVSAALGKSPLVLLPSGPDTVQMLADARSLSINIACMC
jgi:hypothetical protein